MKKIYLLISLSLFVSSCSNTRTVYRTDLTTGDFYYSKSKPSQNIDGNYVFQDLDGNKIQVKKNQYKSSVPFTYAVSP